MTFHEDTYGTHAFRGTKRDDKFLEEFYYIDGENLRALNSLAVDMERQGFPLFANQVRANLKAYPYVE